MRWDWNFQSWFCHFWISIQKVVENEVSIQDWSFNPRLKFQSGLKYRIELFRKLLYKISIPILIRHTWTGPEQKFSVKISKNSFCNIFHQKLFKKWSLVSIFLTKSQFCCKIWEMAKFATKSNILPLKNYFEKKI